MFFAPPRHVFFISFLLISSSLLTAESEPINHYNTVNHNSHISGAAPIFNTKIKPQFNTITTATIDAIGVKIGDISILILQTIKDIKNLANKTNVELLKDLIKKIMWQHRYKIAGSTIIGSYSATSLLLLADYHHLDNDIFWGRWKHQSTFEDLCAIPQRELAKELMLAVGEHHYNKSHPTDLAYPLITFIKQIDWEIETIKRYIKVSQMIKRMALMKIFPTNDNKLNRATKMLERVLFIKHIFLSWLADYNLTSAEKLNS